MVPLSFRLKVPGRDLSSADTVAWTTFRLNGLLTFDGQALHIEWSGTGLLDSVTGAEVESSTVAIPREHLAIPLVRIRSVRLRGGWWRPRLEVSGNDLEALCGVPSEEGGRVFFWLDRRERKLAEELVIALRVAAHTLGAADPTVPPKLPRLESPDAPA